MIRIQQYGVVFLIGKNVKLTQRGGCYIQGGVKYLSVITLK